MSSIDYRIYSPSYKRSNLAISHKLFPRELFTYVVREEEADLYKKFNVDLMIIPKGTVHDISTTRNWILENKKSKYLVTVDDDMKDITWLLKRTRKKLTKDEIIYFIELGFTMATDAGAGLWGMNVNSDPLAYQINKPFGFADMILGPFTGIIDTDLRYDEELPLKEDYDISLQCLNKHKKTFRINFLSYNVDHQKLEGGCQTYRTSEREIEQNELFQKKWGSKIVKHNNRTDRDTINMIVKTGL